MKTPDVNVLLSARDSLSAHHEVARAWIEQHLSGRERIGFATVAILGFIRISTNPRVVATPLSASQALDQIDEWLAAPTATLIQPTGAHLQTLRRLLEKSGTAGNLTTDAHLATLAIEYNATLASFDGDFHRFESLSFEYLG